MALANHFGDQAGYKCKNCGLTVALYAPLCPRCMDNTLVQIERGPEKYRPGIGTDQNPETKKEAHPLVPVAVLAIVLALAVTLYNKFGPPKTEPMTRTEYTPTVESTPAAPPHVSTVRVSNNKHSKPSNTRPVAKAHVSTPASSSPAAKPATPMKLWTESSDE